MPPNPLGTPSQPIAPQTAPTNQSTADSQPKRGRALVYNLFVVILLIAAIAGTYFWQQSKIKKLNTQLATANAKAAVPSAASSSAQDYLYLYAYGAKIPLSSGIQDLYYTDTKQSADDILDFSTQSLLNVDNSCLAVPFGNVFSYTDSLGNNPQTAGGGGYGYVEVLNHAAAADQVGTLDTQIGTLEAHVGTYYYYFKHTQSVCASSTADENLENQQETLFITAIKNLKPID